MSNIWIIAQQNGGGISSEPVSSQGQTTTQQQSGPGPADPNFPAGAVKRRGLGNSQYIFLGLMLVMMYFILFRSPRKKQQQHKQMVQTLAKNDKVRTIGGIIGTVVDVKGDEIILKVDESNNTKIRIASSAIGKNLSKESN